MRNGTPIWESFNHKVTGVLDPIYSAGACVWFLPEYSPDLNPVKLMWSKFKSLLRKTKLRKLKPRTFDDLLEATAFALDSVTLDDILGWFSYHGYCVNV